MTLVASALARGPRVADIDDAGALRAGSTQHSGNGSLKTSTRMTLSPPLVCCSGLVGRPIREAGEEGRAIHLWVSQAKPWTAPASSGTPFPPLWSL